MEKKVPKVLMVVESDTVAHPRAVVVHPHDTSVADGTVVTARRPHNVALHTEPPVNERFNVRAEQVDHLVFD